jgi:hypothetical protein
MLGIIVGGLNAIYLLWGMAAFWVAVFGTFMFLLWLQNRTGGYGSADDAAFLLGNAPPPSLPPGKPQLPPSGTPQIGRASTAITTSRPGPAAGR